MQVLRIEFLGECFFSFILAVGLSLYITPIVIEAAGQSLSGAVAVTGAWDKFQAADVGTLEIKEPGVVEVKVRPKDAASWKAINLRGLKLTPQ